MSGIRIKAELRFDQIFVQALIGTLADPAIIDEFDLQGDQVFHAFKIGHIAVVITEDTAAFFVQDQ